ncbi:MAG: LysR family transcriptional regulator [Opitutaceae bacterium]|nr:LysR family transcriptional regulator [Opitutaceae bacterium]
MDTVPRMPPVQAIRVFEVAARLGNFTRTGEALGMTQAAVSYQIKILEDRLGFSLFERKARHVELTARGAQLAKGSSEAFRLLERTFREVSEDRASVLTIAAPPTFCSNWLVPRLGSFQMANPDLAVRIDTRDEIMDIQAGEADVGLRIGTGKWSGLEARFLFGNPLCVLVSPRAVERFGPFKTPEDLLRLRLFGPVDWWRRWFGDQGISASQLPERTALELETQAMEVAAAISSGDAATIVSPIYFAEQLTAGSLLQPFEASIENEGTHWLVFDKNRAREPKIKAFIEWMLFQPMAFCLAQSGPGIAKSGDAVSDTL